MTLKFRAGSTLFRYSAMLSALRQISKQKMTISSTKLKIRKTVGLKKKTTHTHTHSGGQFQKDAVQFSGFTGFLWTEGRFEQKKGCGFKNTRMRVDGP